jgi:hypothetical protein
MKSELGIEFAICNLEFGNRNLEFRTDEKSSGYRDTHTQFSDGKLHLKTSHNPSEGVIDGEFLYESGDSGCCRFFFPAIYIFTRLIATC